MFSGTTCEHNEDICAVRNPCYNGGSCVGNSSYYKCNCPLGYGGVDCEQSELNLSVYCNSHYVHDFIFTVCNHLNFVTHVFVSLQNYFIPSFTNEIKTYGPSERIVSLNYELLIK